MRAPAASGRCSFMRSGGSRRMRRGRSSATCCVILPWPSMRCTRPDVLSATSAEVNADDDVDGLLVQLPLPDHIDETRVIEAIVPEKDVDGIHPVNAGRLYLGRPTLVPGTPLGIMRMLDEYEIPLEGGRAVVVGRSAIVGKPIAHLLLQRNATVTICHSRTQDLERHTLA